MTGFFRLSTATALATLMTSSAVFADVNAQQVWGDMKTYLQGFGYDVSATEATSGDTLKITDLSMRVKMPDEAGNASFKISEMTFTNTGDGTVSVGIPTVMPIIVKIQPKDDKAADVTIDYTQSGFSMIVSGNADDMTYNYTAANIGMAMTSLLVDGNPVDLGKFEMMMKNVIGSSNMKTGNLRNISQKMQADILNYDIDFKDPKQKGAFQMKGALNALKFDGIGSYPSEMNVDDMAAMLKAGFGFDGTFAYEGGETMMNVDEKGKQTDIRSSSDSGTLSVSMGADNLSYVATAKGLSMNMAGGDIPFPVGLDMAEGSFNLSMPVTQNDQEQDFAFGFKMGDFTMSDMIWGIFDPAAQLPRDPATVAIDLTGKVKLLFDLLDTKQMTAVESGEIAPGELNAVTLNNITVSAVGAALTGSGDFTFDNSDLETFDGMPAPTGAIDLKLVGGNGLLDKLVAMGMLPEDQAMGARMMMGLFAVAGAGEDTLTSKIEVNDQGHVMANGQRLK